MELKTPIGGHHFLASARYPSSNGGSGCFYGSRDGNRIQVRFELFGFSLVYNTTIVHNLET